MSPDRPLPQLLPQPRPIPWSLHPTRPAPSILTNIPKSKVSFLWAKYDFLGLVWVFFVIPAFFLMLKLRRLLFTAPPSPSAPVPVKDLTTPSEAPVTPRLDVDDDDDCESGDRDENDAGNSANFSSSLSPPADPPLEACQSIVLEGVRREACLDFLGDKGNHNLFDPALPHPRRKAFSWYMPRYNLEPSLLVWRDASSVRVRRQSRCEVTQWVFTAEEREPAERQGGGGRRHKYPAPPSCEKDTLLTVRVALDIDIFPSMPKSLRLKNLFDKSFGKEVLQSTFEAGCKLKMERIWDCFDMGLDIARGVGRAGEDVEGGGIDISVVQWRREQQERSA